MYNLRLVLLLILFAGFSYTAFGQTTVSGTITDGESGETLVGANVTIKGKIIGTVTNIDGEYSLTTSIPTPFTVIVTFTGYTSQEKEITGSTANVDFSLETSAVIGSEVIVSASRVEESFMEAPVTIEKMDPITIAQTSSHDYYDGVAKLKGVHVNQGSMTFTSVNTRGFASVANTRFVQLMDGMDNSAPLLNFPTGNVVGISELDIHSIELVPGAGSALYGPNAFNGILFMNSKNPFDYQGLSAQVKVGATNSQERANTRFDATAPYYNASFRYAKAFNDKFAFKINFSVLDSDDWVASDYTDDRKTITTLNDPAIAPSAPNFDGLNMYGDEAQIFVPMAALAAPLSAALAPSFAPFFGNDQAAAQSWLADNIPGLPTLDVRRTGFKEEDLLDRNQARSIKLDAALHYRITDNLEASYLFKRGNGSTVYHGSERYVLRDFSQTFNKVELKGGDFFLRAYSSRTDAGNSYNLSALGAFVNERISPSAAAWVPTYAGTYAGALLPILLQGGTIDDAAVAAANVAGRTAADATSPAVGSQEFSDILEATRADVFQGNPSGAGFIDDSQLLHAEFGYNLSGLLDDVIGLQVGGNVRQYNLFSDGTIFNEDPNNTGTNERIKINEYGFYAQASKALIDARLKLSGSIRYDKNQNFDGQVSPRVSAVFSAGATRQHNFRTSFQTGFRNPDTQTQFIYFPTSTGTLVGGTPGNASRYGVYEGGAYSNSSYQAFVGSVLAGAPNPGLLEEANVSYVGPEQLQVIEVGYKGLINKNFFVDVNYYYNTYNNFNTLQTVVAKEGTTHKGTALPGVADVLAGTASSPQLWRLYTNSPVQITSQGVGFGFAYKIRKGYEIQGNYSYADFNVPADAPTDFEAGFNTPQNRFNVSLGNRDAFNGVGFNVSYRWQDEFDWINSFGAGKVDAFGAIDIQLNYAIKQLKTTVKVGGTNIGGNDYRTIVGGPYIGQLYYISFTFDEFLN